MNTCINSYKQCLADCSSSACRNTIARPHGSSVCRFVCEDKFRTCLGDHAKKHGGNNLWPHQNANYDYNQYIAVKDQDHSFVSPPQTHPFAIPPNQIRGGHIGAANRRRPYQYLNEDRYGEMLKCTRPSSRDPIYY